MAPTGVTVRASKSKSSDKIKNLTITSAVVKKGRPTVVKYSWTTDPKNPITEFAVGVIDVATKEQTILEGSVLPEYHGKNSGTLTVDITYLKNKPGKYLLVFLIIDFEDFSEVIAKSKAFQLKKSDF